MLLVNFNSNPKNLFNSNFFPVNCFHRVVFWSALRWGLVLWTLVGRLWSCRELVLLSFFLGWKSGKGNAWLERNPYCFGQYFHLVYKKKCLSMWLAFWAFYTKKIQKLWFKSSCPPPQTRYSNESITSNMETCVFKTVPFIPTPESEDWKPAKIRQQKKTCIYFFCFPEVLKLW